MVIENQIKNYISVSLEVKKGARERKSRFQDMTERESVHMETQSKVKLSHYVDIHLCTYKVSKHTRKSSLREEERLYAPGCMEFPLVFRRTRSRMNNLLYAFSRMDVVECDRIND